MSKYVNQPLDQTFAALIRGLVEQEVEEHDLSISFYFALSLCGQHVILRFTPVALGDATFGVEALNEKGEPVNIDGTLSVMAQTTFVPSAVKRPVFLSGSERSKTFDARELYGGMIVLYQLREKDAPINKGEQVMGRWIVTPEFDLKNGGDAAGDGE